ncbi:MAG TPA: DNA polymerase I [Actinobacteria bacterium]|nr:DNA polymerase I [Actinomycetota bacterium]
MKLALLDGHSLAYRAFYALPSDLATPTGQVTNAVFGFTSMLIKLLTEERPDAVVVAWDLPGPTFRTEAYEEYKAQREAAPDLFTEQLPLIHEVLEALGIPQLGVPGYEADDVIATLARRARARGWEVLVVTGDRDAFQLLEPGITVLYTRRGISDIVRADPAWLEERYGIRPDQYVDYAALRGDPSDNLPGVPGVGEKTAARLLRDHGDLEGIYAHLDELSPKLRENLAGAREQVFLNRDLMRLRDDVPLPDDFSLDELRLEPFDRERVREVFDALAFRGLWERLAAYGGFADPPSDEDPLDVEVTTASTDEEVAALAADGPAGVEPLWDDDALVGVVAAAGDRIAYVPAEGIDPLVDRGAFAAHDAKPLVRALLEMGLEPEVGFDTALAAHLVNPARRVTDLAGLAERELGLVVETADDEERARQGAFDFDDRGPDLDRAGRRALAVRRLVEPLTRQLEVRGELALFREVELRLVPVLARMEIAGVLVDRPYLEDLGEDLRRRLAEIERAIHEAAGGPFNVNSTHQLRTLLFERLGLPVVKKTPKGAPSTDASVLEKLASEHPVVADILRYRELEKLRGTYVDALLRLVGDDGRIRGRFNQMGAATGRLSMERPNLQNIPVRTEEGRAIRRAFVAPEGSVLFVADYSQIELRILAHLSGDPGLVEAFAEGLDVHAATAARISGIAPDAVTPELRRRAKAINFGLLYGMEAYGLAERLGISREEAQAHIDAYFEQFPEVAAFMRGIVARARETGYTTTLLGRRRYLPELQSTRYRDRQMGERMALNAPIQGTAADIIKKAMVELDAELAARFEARMILQIHDELVLEVPLDELETVERLTREVMEGVVRLDVPLVVDVASGPTLADCLH